MSIISKCAIAKGDGTFIIDTVTVANPLADEVLVKIKAAGLCHTDHDSLNWGKPIVMGHEGAGIVVATGSNVKSVKVGDAVILNWATPCGECFQCTNENEHICENNSPVVAGANGYTPGHAHKEGTLWNNTPIERSFNIGTLSEYTLVKESAVVKNTIENMPFPAASIVSCGVMTGFGSAVNTAKVKEGASAVVLGTGGVGLNVIQGIKVSKASKKVKALTDGRGADYAFECTAIPALGAAPLAMVRNAGTAVQVSGIEQEVLIDMALFEWDKIYINPLYGKCNPQKDFPKILDHYKNGEIKLDEMITRTYPLEKLQQAFDDMLTGKNAKGVIVFE
ncbi:MAG: alcohol dehydrogenase catalytic domain-containing protein [Lutimonas sp.]